MIIVESGGDNLSATFSPELVDLTLYMIDVAGGEKVPRKGGPGITRSDLLIVNKTDLAPHVGASLEVMARDAERMREGRPALRRMKFGFSLIVRGNDATPETFREVAERAESREIDALWLSAHVILPPQTKSDYVMVPGLAHPPHWRERYWEPFTVLGYLAAVTSKIRLGTSIVVLPQHNPFEVAKQVAEIDQLSNGRMIFGVGAGWFEEEFEVLGQNYKNRGAQACANTQPTDLDCRRQ